jgi:serine/threonine protein kinase/WD40 repeat protein
MSVQTPCPPPDTFRRLLIGRLALAEAEPVAAHLDACPGCVAALAGLAADDTLADALHATASGTPPPPSERLHAVMERLRQLPRATTTDAPANSEEAPDLAFLAPAQAPDEIGRLGGYRVLRLLGSGGMGLVFEAEDEQLRRRVALKVMRPEVACKPTAKSRFLREARLAAALDHDHVVHIYQVGEDRGVPFLTMQFLEGMSLEMLLKRGGRLKLAQVLRIGRQIAAGLAAAHERGLIHRDVKPGNVWIEKEHGGRVKLLDFGLARSLDTGEPLTQSGAIVGTPAYMAPEQARGETVDARADLFSLGCVLYELTTGRRPFAGPNPMAILNSLALHTPPAPRQVDAEVPAALSELVMQLLEKDPAKRPASAREVESRLAVDEAARFGPPPATKRAASSTKRRLLVAAGLLFLLGGGALLQQIIIRIYDKDGKQVGQATVPEHGSFSATSAKPPPKEPDTRPAGPEIGAGRPATAFDALRREDIPPYELKVAGGGDPKQAPPELAAVFGDSRFWHPGGIGCLAFTPDGKTIISGGAGPQGSVRFWDPETGLEQRVFKSEGYGYSIALPQEGKMLAAIHKDPKTGWDGRSTGSLWDINTQQAVRTFPASFVATVSPDGKLLASSLESFNTKLSDVPTGKERRTLRGRWGRSLAFDPDGKLLAVGGAVLDVASGELRYITGAAASAAFSPDGRMLATGADRVQLWDAATGARKFKVPHEWHVTVVAISPDGKMLATGSNDGTVKVRVVASGKELRTLKAHSPGDLSLAFSPDGTILATSLSCPDHKTRVWDLTTGEQRRELEGGGVIAFSGDGQLIAIGHGSGSQGRICIWHISTGARVGTAMQAHGDGVSALSLSPDGKTLASWGTNQSLDDPVKLWDISTQKELRSFKGRFPSFGPDGKLLVFLTADGWKLIDLATGEGVRTLNTQPIFSPDGKLLASLIGEGKVRLWDFDSRSGGLVVRKTFQAVPSWMTTRGLWFSPDGRHLLTLNGNGTIYVFRLAPPPVPAEK